MVDQRGRDGALRARRAGVPRAGAIARLAGFGLLVSAAGGCEVDGWLFDPSVVGRWEHTPTVVPVLERIDVIERDTGEFVEVTPVEAEDLVPEPTDYRVAPGDLIQIEILDFIQPGVVSAYERVVNAHGFIDLPQLGPLQVADLTRADIEQLIRQAIIAAQVVDDPLVTVQIPGRRQATFSIFGAIEGVGRYGIPNPDYRLLQALTDAGGVNPAIPKVLVIRQVTLTDVAESTLDLPDQTEPAPTQPDEGEDLLQLIDELTTPPDGQRRDDGGALPNPGAFRSSGTGDRTQRVDPDRDPFGGRAPQVDATPIDLPDPDPIATAPHFAMVQSEASDQPPPIDLPDTTLEPEEPQPPTEPIVEPQPMPQVGHWVFLNGAWVQVISGEVGPAAAELDEGADPLAEAEGEPLVTQRVIEVPTKPLLQGVARYNVVVRPGDVISVPGPEQGLVYVGGPGINRPGVYNLPLTGKLTLQRLVFSAGGFSAIAIPQRVDLTRMVGEDRQATIRVNLKAIFAGTHPDIVLKPDDLVNVGTNFWATPMAIIRGGFRTSYGFGFLLDRNFGNDVFGPPPTNLVGQ